MINTVKELETRLHEYGAITHAGNFHADDVFSTALLEYFFGKFKLERAFIVPDDFQGIAFDIGLGQFDHHQSDNECYDDGIPMASLGKLARIIIPQKLGLDVYEKILPWLKDIEENDNTGRVEKFGNSPHPLALAISLFNIPWDKNFETLQEKEAYAYECFFDAVQWAKKLLELKFEEILRIQKAKDIVKNSNFLSFPLFSVLLLDTYCPWKSVSDEEILFCIYPSNRGGYNIEAKDTSIISLPSVWKEHKPNGCTFVHNSLFLASFKTREDAINAITEFYPEIQKSLEDDYIFF